MRTFESGETGIIGRSGLRVDRPDFVEQAAVQTRISTGDGGGFVEVVSKNEPVAADHFLGFSKRAVCYHIFTRDCFTVISKSLSVFHSSLVDQSIEPDVKPVDRVLYFIP